MSEVRVVNETTGGEKGSKDARFSLVPWDLLWQVAELYGAGAKKYAPRNWEKGYDWSLSFDALHRHLVQFWNGESIDSETKCHHLTSVIFHCFALMQFEEKHPELDDRPVTSNRREFEEENATRLMKLFNPDNQKRLGPMNEQDLSNE